MKAVFSQLACIASLGFFLFLATLPFDACAEQRRVALVIGNSDYKQIPKLSNTLNDADDMAKALRGFGFEVILRKNETKRGMTEALAELGRKAKGAEAALLYYAGHGMQVRGENYLLPVNVSTSSEAAVIDESVNMNRVLDELEGGARINVVMLDACRDNPITGQYRSAGRGLAATTAVPKGTVIVYATDPGNTAADVVAGGRNGLFTASMLRALQGDDLSLQGVLTLASAEVDRASEGKQTPYVNGPPHLQRAFQFKVAEATGPTSLEKDFWTSVSDSNDAADLEAYLAKYPKGSYKVQAENRLKRLNATNPSTQLAARNDPARPLNQTPAATATRTGSPANRPQGNTQAVPVDKIDLSGTLWQRCSQGQTWVEEQKACAGTATTLSYAEAEQAAALLSAQSKDWSYRLPLIEELATLIDCSPKKATQTVRASPKLEFNHWCELGAQKPAASPALATGLAPNFYWSQTTTTQSAEQIPLYWGVSFEYGAINQAINPKAKQRSIFVATRKTGSGSKGSKQAQVPKAQPEQQAADQASLPTTAASSGAEKKPSLSQKPQEEVESVARQEQKATPPPAKSSCSGITNGKSTLVKLPGHPKGVMAMVVQTKDDMAVLAVMDLSAIANKAASRVTVPCKAVR